MQILLFVSFIIIIIMICTKISVNLIEHFVMANLTKIKKTIHKNCVFHISVMRLWFCKLESHVRTIPIGVLTGAYKNNPSLKFGKH